MSDRAQPMAADAAELQAEIDALMEGARAAAAHDARRFPRFNYQSRVQAAIYPHDGGSGQQPQCRTMLTRDLSRGGVNLLHTDQLLLGQRVALALSASGPRLVEVMWCRRIAHRCYSIGCRFIKTSNERDA